MTREFGVKNAAVDPNRWRQKPHVATRRMSSSFLVLLSNAAYRPNALGFPGEGISWLAIGARFGLSCLGSRYPRVRYGS